MSAAARVLQPVPPKPTAAGPNTPAALAPRALGATLWDEAGRAYLDFDNRAGAVILGHADPLVDAAAADPRATAAAEAAERLTGLVRAESARLTRSDASALLLAIEAARVHTGRTRVLACAGRPVPGAVTAFRAGDLHQLAALLALFVDEIAAVVIEPVGHGAPPAGWLAGARVLTRRHGALLIYDETRMGLRLHEGGAEALTGVGADLSVFGHALGNGAIVGAVTGPRDLLTAPSSAGPADLPACAAVAATLARIENEPVVATLAIRGAEIQAEVERIIAAAGIGDRVTISGDPSWSLLGFPGPGGAALKASFIQAAAAHGLHTTGAHVISCAHGDAAVSTLVCVYAEILPPLVAQARGAAWA